MPRAIYGGTEYETMRYNATTERWYLTPAQGHGTVLVSSQADELEVECERCGEFKAYVYPVTAQALWLCSNCEEAITHGK
jgi:hypothetical protein